MSSARRRKSSAFAPRLVIMAKEPMAGAAKARLARDIGSTAAIRFYRTALRHTLMRVGTDPRWRTYLAVAPDTGVARSCWPSWPSVQRIAQGGGDLGQRMQHLFDCLPPGPVVLIGSDILAVSRAHIASAFRRLGNADAVFGPAQDGGYWLVGLKRSPKRLAPFAQVPWSTDKALAATCANLKGRRVALVATLNDVDTEEDLANQGTHAERLVL
ncbi:MAG: TIGR04282 family arsenosugar biosynthesis glycosyltransferase [Methyloceanibacter sp.]|nr:TIGR04282 family arsenosugar biosynthesis glycosyltransferase [Methyloceanibacter sp.]